MDERLRRLVEDYAIYREARDIYRLIERRGLEDTRRFVDLLRDPSHTYDDIAKITGWQYRTVLLYTKALGDLTRAPAPPGVPHSWARRLRPLFQLKRACVPFLYPDPADRLHGRAFLPDRGIVFDVEKGWVEAPLTPPERKP